MTNSKSSVAIIGGGFCGIMTLVHLINKSKAPIKIILFNAGYPLAKGIAFDTYTEQHVLNVACSRMSAFPDEPDHFLNWCKSKPNLKLDSDNLGEQYLPRNLYGEYLNDIFTTSLKNCPSHVEVEIINEEAVNIIKEENSYSIFSAIGKKVVATKIVLATGNHAPTPPSIKETAFLESSFYFGNPWNEAATASINSDRPILIIGTGLTMVDVVIGLENNNFQGKIYALSPKGFQILSHKKYPTQRDILDELSPPYELKSLFKLFYKYVRSARRKGVSGEAVVDAVRSKTQDIWQNLSLADKKSFMSHLRHLWGVARHRLPEELHKKIQQMISDKKLEILAGRILDMRVDNGMAKIKLKQRASHNQLELEVQRVINCTGPQTDITKYQSKLFQNLITQGLIRADEMNLGIDATEEVKIIESDGTSSESLFTLGSLLKGKLWESTAVPELRVQAERLATIILEKL